jgi:hypothetical protein
MDLNFAMKQREARGRRVTIQTFGTGRTGTGPDCESRRRTSAVSEPRHVAHLSLDLDFSMFSHMVHS